MSKDSSIKVFAENASGTRPANAIPVWIDNISAIGGGGGSDFDPTYMSAQIDNKLNKSEVGFRKWGSLYYVSAISGKEISARYAVTAQNANTATTAIYDDNGNYLTDTYNNLTALNSFVQSNSASWGQGGGGSTGDSIPLRTQYYDSEENGSTTTSYYLSSDGSTFTFTAFDDGNTPSDLIINGNNYSWSYNNGRWEIPHSINGQESIQWYNNVGLQYSGQDIIRSLATSEISTALNKVVVNCNMGSITGNIDVRTQIGQFTFTAFTGNWSGEIPSSYNGEPITSYNVYIGNENYGNDCSYTLDTYNEFEAGSTVASGDVFPPTNNLDPYTTYYLGWNANNGGLFWYQPAGN